MMNGGSRKINYAEGCEGLYIDGTDRQACISYSRGVEASGVAMTIVHDHHYCARCARAYSAQKRVGT